MKIPLSVKSWIRWNRERRRDRRRRVSQLVAEMTGGIVQRGPFAGMHYPAAVAAGSVLAPKLLGTYELEIHSWLEAAIGRAPRHVVNLGAGEGYYAVGLALRLPLALIDAFEADPAARDLCVAMADANGVADRISMRARCGVDELRAALPSPALVLCDIEGAELELLDPDRVPALRACEIIVEIHGGRSMGERIRSRFRDTHEAESVRFGHRSRRDAAGVVRMGRRDLVLAVDERRRRGRDWIHLLPRAIYRPF